MAERWKIGGCILVQKKARGQSKKKENIIEENQTRVFPEGLVLRGQRGAVAEPAPEKPGCIWGAARWEQERERWDLLGEAPRVLSNTSGQEKLSTALLRQGLYTKEKKSYRERLPCFENCSAQVHHLQEVGGQEGTDR